MAHLGFGDPIKQYPGQVQVTRAVKVLAPGKHFNNLTPAEAKQSYWVVATEYRERYAFEKHVKAWGAAHKGPGVRFVAEGDALDDPDNKGFWRDASHWAGFRFAVVAWDKHCIPPCQSRCTIYLGGCLVGLW